MSLELNLRFPNPGQVIVRLGDNETPTLTFTNPLSDAERDNLAWYVETYGAHSLGDPDDDEAKRIAARLPKLGKALFEAVFAARDAERLFNKFQDANGEQRLITVSADHPAILALPWELLHDPSEPDGVHLFHETLSIRRRVAGASGARGAFEFRAKPHLHLLFVVSRPDDAGFLDPRSDTQAVLDALDRDAPGRVTWEFLRPATLDALTRRLDDDRLPPVDVLHFDGHGVFDERGGLPERYRKNHPTHAGRGEAIQRDASPDPDSPPDTGYLLFEDGEGSTAFVSAHQLGENLHRSKIALVILSACQTAKLGDAPDGALGGVAARLTAAGIPAVLAMTHSVLIHTTRALFGEFYRQLALHRPIGAALDAARRHLANHPEKYEVQRNTERVKLKLHDWFVPALYQHGADGPLLVKDAEPASATAPLTNLRARPEAGFFGRRGELWDIERWFAGPTRRITVSGFGGQGKTALAEEAGRWLTRTGMFKAAVFVDYSQSQSADAVAVAVNEIAAVLGQTLLDANAATAALKATPTLVILDNLETLPADALTALLDAAVHWSKAGETRLLCTTRRPDFHHPAYATTGALEHRSLVLRGLTESDALEWAAALFRLPPAPLATPSRDALAALFERVAYHPLTLRVLVQQIRTRRIAEVSQRLDALLAAPDVGVVGEDTPASLLASLRLSLDRLDPAARALLPRLGVFQGGAMEVNLLTIAGFEKVPNLWASVRRQLEDAALLKVEMLENVSVPYLCFHPTLAPVLWAELDYAQRASLKKAFRRHYYQIARYLYDEDGRHPHQVRAIARHELSNLLHAVFDALEAGEPDAVQFAHSLSMFLNVFSLNGAAKQLAASVNTASGEVGSEAWYLVRAAQGDQLLATGQVSEASGVFADILKQSSDEPCYRRAVTLASLARCQRTSGQTVSAETTYRRSLELCANLGQDEDVRQLTSALLSDLADTYLKQGRYHEARQHYKSALGISQELGDVRGQGVVHGQLGTLAFAENDLTEAARRFQATLTLFRQLQEPATEAAALHQLGRVFQRGLQYDDAEQCYREAARIFEKLANLPAASISWNQLANICKAVGRVDAAEAWYRKSLALRRKTAEPLELVNSLHNLATLLMGQPNHTDEARQLTSEALDLMKHFDPGSAEIWKTHTLLAAIAEQEATADPARAAELVDEAEDWRRQSRAAFRAFPGSRQALRRFAPLLAATLAAHAGHPEGRAALAENQATMRRGSPDWARCAAAFDRLLAGERDADTLCMGLDYETALLVETLALGLDDPASLADLLPQPQREGDAGSVKQGWRRKDEG